MIFARGMQDAIDDDFDGEMRRRFQRIYSAGGVSVLPMKPVDGSLATIRT